MAEWHKEHPDYHEMGIFAGYGECDGTEETPRREYPQREIFAYGRYIQCQILNWEDGPPPKFLVCNPLDRERREEFLATQGMGTWMRVDLCHALWLMERDKS